MNRAQLEASASILLRDAAAELCGKTARPSAADLTRMSPTSRSRLNDAELVFKSLGYGQASINGLETRLQGLPAGPECRAHVISALWQHFTALGRSKADSGSESPGAPDMVDLPAVAELPQLPTATEQQREPSTPARPLRQVSQQLPGLSVAPLVGLEASTPSNAAPRPAAEPNAAESAPPSGPVAAEGASAGGPVAAEGASAGGTTSAPVPADSSGAPLPFATRHLGWVGVGLMLGIAALGGWWLRRRKPVTSAELARRRLRPS